MPTTAAEQKALDLLEQTHTWPCLFAFKFILIPEARASLEALMPVPEKVEERSSSGGKYRSLTFHCAVGSAREVLQIYAKAQGLKGLVWVG